MKMTSLYAIALLLVPWSSCTEPTVREIANPSTPVSSKANLVMPDVKDTTLPSGRKNIYLPACARNQDFLSSALISLPGIKECHMFIMEISM